MSEETKPAVMESLFSLEIAVDSISVPNDILCRFPALAFRLLDFPTLLVYHVEPEWGESIKKKISLASHPQDIPLQFKELQDREGKFLVKKGKSCLFKASPDLLHSLLSNTPLYVMLVDTYPDTPRLLANCTIPLDAVIDRVHEDIGKLGLSIPHVHGERGTFKLYNLMSENVGEVAVGYRILSLGMSLMQHIPAQKITEVKAESVLSSVMAKPSISPTGTVPDQVDHSPAAQHEVQIQVNPPVTRTQTMCIQTDSKGITDTVGTQTERRRPKAKSRSTAQSKIKQQEDEFIFSNTICPQPLFYNSKAQEISDLDIMPDSRPHEVYGYPREEDRFEYDDLSDDETIRPEDVCIDKKEEASSEHAFEEKRKSPVSQNLPRDRQLYQRDPTAPKPIQATASNLPILNALVEEILTLCGGPSSSLLQNFQSVKTASHPLSPHSKRSDPARQREELLNRLVASRVNQLTKEDRHKGHVTCAAGPPEVPKNKSWLRQAPSIQSYGIKKTKLMPGLTNTQRLRLAKTNPNLLQNLEKQEQERLEKRRVLLLAQKAAAGEEQPVTLQEVNPFEKVDKIGPGVVHSSDFSAHVKRPVPTPRHSKSREKMEELVHSVNQGIEEKQPVLSPKSKARAMKMQSASLEKVFFMSEDGDGKGSAASSARTNSQGSEIHIQGPSVDRPKSLSDFSDEEDPRSALGRTHTLPNRFNVSDELKVSDYSEDFASAPITTARSAKEPDLRRFDEHYSDFSEASDHQAVGRASPDFFSSQSESEQHSDYFVKISRMDDLDSRETDRSKDLASARSEKVLSSAAVPKKKPLRRLDKQHSLTTDSVSSYVPSEEDKPQGRHHSPEAYYSDEFEDISEEFVPQAKSMKELHIDPKAKMGYTWGGL